MLNPMATQAKQKGLSGRPRELLKQGLAAAAGVPLHAIMLEGMQRQPGGLGMQMRISVTFFTHAVEDAAIRSFKVIPRQSPTNLPTADLECF